MKQRLSEYFWVYIERRAGGGGGGGPGGVDNSGFFNFSQSKLTGLHPSLETACKLCSSDYIMTQ